MQVLFRAKDIETGEWRYGWYNQWYDDETYMRYHHISLDN